MSGKISFQRELSRVEQAAQGAGGVLNVWAKQDTKARKNMWVPKSGILLYTSASYIDCEINFVGERRYR